LCGSVIARGFWKAVAGENETRKDAQIETRRNLLKQFSRTKKIKINIDGFSGRVKEGLEFG
jgi:hypothetical protein